MIVEDFYRIGKGLILIVDNNMQIVYHGNVDNIPLNLFPLHVTSIKGVGKKHIEMKVEV